MTSVVVNASIDTAQRMVNDIIEKPETIGLKNHPGVAWRDGHHENSEVLSKVIRHGAAGRDRDSCPSAELARWVAQRRRPHLQSVG